MSASCATCGHERDQHNAYGIGWCTWAQNPMSRSSSVFCKCIRFTERRLETRP